MVLVIDHNTSPVARDRFYDLVQQAIDSREKSPIVAFDVEGVNLSRVGTVELVSLAFEECSDGEEAVFLVDVGTKNQEGRDGRVAALKKLLESQQVEKVIHDCRMDCDALFHLHGIQVANIHDTSIYHELITHNADVNLNETLAYYGMEENEARDKSIYRREPNFWVKRPLTQTMIDWASSDVDKLIHLARQQKDRLSSLQLNNARDKSKQNSESVSSMKLERGMRLQGNKSVGSFIGRRGANVRDLQRKTGTMIYKDFGAASDNVWMVFYPSQAALQSVKRAMGHS